LQQTSNNLKIALLEDQQSEAKLLKLFIESTGASCEVYESGESLISGLPELQCDLLILDWELPDISGDKILIWVRQNMGWTLPVIFVTGRDASEDIVSMLEAGADDYMVKPIDFKELLARIQSLVRRTNKEDKSIQVIHEQPFLVDFKNHTITRSGKKISMTPKEFEVTGYLFRNIGELVPRDKLLQELWGYGPEINTRTIDIHISRIRKKLKLSEQNGWLLTSIYHQGYRLDRIE
jgi:two-component system, OmpR family, response regulator RegX3